MDIVDAVIERWKREGVVLNPGAAGRDLKELEELLGVPLPEEFRSLYSKANGMSESTYDSHLVSFWPISRIREELEKGGGKVVGFADVSIDSWRFVFRISPDGIQVLSENVAPGLEPEVIGLFRDFLSFYLNDSDRLGII